MSRSKSFIHLQKLRTVAHFCAIKQVPALDAIGFFSEPDHRFTARPFIEHFNEKLNNYTSRLSALYTQKLRKPGKQRANIAIIGAGIAGLSCAYELSKKGVQTTIYEASERVGGRCYSRSNFYGHNIELGGELIDSQHENILAYAREFGLSIEDITKTPGEHAYYFFGQHYHDHEIIDEYNALVATMRHDLQSLSSQPTALNHTPHDVRLDQINLSEYLDKRGASQLLKAVFRTACEGEYGVPLEQQSCLSFLLFINTDRNSYLRPWGIFSDERYHIVEGNQQIPLHLAARLENKIHYNMPVEKIARSSSGAIRLYFANGTTTHHDAVVLALPFTVLRNIELDESLALPNWKINAIQQSKSGTNAKTMYAFTRPYWRELGHDGVAEADLPNHQTTWETNPSLATNHHAILTDFASGARGARLLPDELQINAENFLHDLNLVYPGIEGLEIRSADNKVAAVLQPWPHSPYAKGSYSCNAPGYFTSIAGLEALPVNNLLFAGEHTDSVYEWQGTMEGALRSGLRASNEVLQQLK